MLNLHTVELGKYKLSTSLVRCPMCVAFIKQIFDNVAEREIKEL
jgi:hypothetical protein